MKKIIMMFSLVLCFLCVSCSFFTPKEDDSPSKPTPTPPPAAVVTGIQLVDDKGDKLTEATALQEFSSTAIYNHNGVRVLAIYSNDTKKDVTMHATFSAVDLSKKGKVNVDVTYLTFKETYELNIIDNTLTSIELSLWATKLVYEVGDTFSTTGLVVSGVYKSGSHQVLDDYEIKITDSNQIEYSKTQAFTQSDVYDINVSVGEISKTYQIAVYSDHYSMTNSLDVTTFATNESMNFSSEGTYTYPSRKTIFTDGYSSLSLQSTAFRNKDINGDSIRQTVDGKIYDTAIELTDQEDMKLTLNQKTDLLLVVGGINGRGIVFTDSFDEETKIYSIGNVNHVASLLYVQLEAGTYEMKANYGNLLVYNIDFNYAVLN